MVKKSLSFELKTKSMLFLIVTFALFLAINYFLSILIADMVGSLPGGFKYVILAAWYAFIYWASIVLYYKIFRFTIIKPTITEKEFAKLGRERSKIIKRKYKRKKYAERAAKSLSKADTILDKHSVYFSGWPLFFLFSVYYGIYLRDLKGVFKESTRNAKKMLKQEFSWEQIKYDFTLKFRKRHFRWYKVLDNKEHIYKYIMYSYVK